MLDVASEMAKRMQERHLASSQRKRDGNCGEDEKEEDEEYV